MLLELIAKFFLQIMQKKWNVLYIIKFDCFFSYCLMMGRALFMQLKSMNGPSGAKVSKKGPSESPGPHLTSRNFREPKYLLIDTLIPLIQINS